MRQRGSCLGALLQECHFISILRVEQSRFTDTVIMPEAVKFNVALLETGGPIHTFQENKNPGTTQYTSGLSPALAVALDKSENAVKLGAS